MSYYLGLDVGTSGLKALATNLEGQIVAQASRSYEISTPQPQWSEQNPHDWVAAAREVLDELPQHPVRGLGLSGQMHGLVLLDAEDRVLRPAILWNDQRTAAECAEIDAIVGPERIREITCNPPMTGFQLPKLLWVRRHEPEIYGQIRKVLLPKDYVRYALTGIFATDVSDASGTGMFDVPRRRWSKEIAQAFDIDLGWFPPAFESYATVGEWEGAHLVAGAGDQAGAAYGVGATEPGIVSISLGTSGVVYGVTKSPKAGRTTNTFCDANGGWHTMGVMLSCGGALRWYRDTLSRNLTYDEIAAEAAKVESEGLAFTPYLTGERCPIDDPNLTASFSGIGLHHTRPHFSRAVFEGLCEGLVGAFSELEKQGVTANEIRVTGGGARSDFWLELLSDRLQRTCVRWPVDEGPAYGAALLASRAV